MKLAAIVVHYRTPELARRCVEALRREEAAGGLALEVVVVDNGSDAEGRAVLESLPARLVDSGANLGYAGGANRGVAAVLEGREVDGMLVMNPDVLVEPGCLGELGAALVDGAGVAGPRFLWDTASGDLLPPLEPVSRRWELLRRLGEHRGGRWACRARRSWRRHARRHWAATETIASRALSGALLAIRADAWSRVGPFDEQYRLYFEETDWLERAHAAGVACRHVPSARAVHLYAQSTPSEPRAARWFAESQARFRRRHLGAWLEPALRAIDRLPGGPSVAMTPATTPATAAEPSPWPHDPDVRWIETSPSPLGVPAAGRPTSKGVGPELPLVPATLRPRMAAGDWWLRAVDEAGRERHLRRVRIAD